VIVQLQESYPAVRVLDGLCKRAPFDVVVGLDRGVHADRAAIIRVNDDGRRDVPPFWLTRTRSTAKENKRTASSPSNGPGACG
jgi:hypothetical protein